MEIFLPLTTIVSTIIWSILGTILFLKIWGMTNNVKEIHDWLMEDKFKKERSSVQNPPKFTPYSEKRYEGLSEEAVPNKPFSGDLKKGDKVSIAEYGICTFEGMWEGKYAFYPENNTDLPLSAYLVNDVEPYLLIPKNKLTSVLV